jgi:hypothetical protein
MRSLNSFLESSWTQTYKSTDQAWLSDSLNWEKTSSLVAADWSLISFIFQSSFTNQHVLVDSISKTSYLDVMLINSSSTGGANTSLFDTLMGDITLQTNSVFFPLSSLLQSEYQETFSTTLLVAPELSMVLRDYISTYWLSATFNNLPTAAFDSYTNNLNYFPGEGMISFMLFGFYVWFLVYFFTLVLSLKWSTPVNAHFVRWYYYFFSMSRETRVQFEAVMQTLVFILLYWAMVLMAFDDDQEEVIEFIDTGFFYFFSFIIAYLCFKHSMHYFAFLEASKTETRSVKFIASQFVSDFIATFSLMLRFYTLLFRMNVYDNLDDFFDSYYIFVGDFDDDEYLNELFLSIHGTILFTLDNNDDRSFLLEDENDFSNDLFYTYFVLWGKLYLFVFFIAELAARLGLAFYIFYLIIFEVHAVNCSYREDTFMDTKKA